MAYQTKGRAGKPTTNAAIYGYRKDPEDKDHWLIDEEAAAVVRRIYQLAISGKGYAEIARILRDDRIETPAYYLAHRNGRTVNAHGGEGHRYDWYVTTIGAIIAKPEYKGDTVNFRTGHKSYKDKRTKNPEEDWLIFENTHEAIVDPETWALAQRAAKVIHRTDTVGEANPLTGLMFCADCGHRMYNHRHWNTTPKGKKYLIDSYECGTFNCERHRTEQHCCSHHISTKAVRSLILDAIRHVSRYALEDEQDFIQKVREASEVQQEETAKNLKRKLRRDEKRCKELDTLLKKLYESYALGKLPEKRYEALSAEYEQEQADLEEAITAGQQELDAYNEDTTRIDQFMALAKKYTDFTELTTPMIYEFVGKILVHKAEKIDGERVQEVEIYLKYVGKVDIPEPELTSEELEEEEKAKRRRKQARDYHYRKKARQQAQAAATSRL